MPRLRQVHTTDAHELAQTLFGMLFGERDPVDEPGGTCPRELGDVRSLVWVANKDFS